MSTRNVIFVFKDVFRTRMMQTFDVFESFKFVGEILEAVQDETHFHLTPQEVLDRSLRASEGIDFTLVGVIIPDVGSAFLSNHTVYSDGHKWTTVHDMCEAYKAPLEKKDDSANSRSHSGRRRTGSTRGRSGNGGSPSRRGS
jgi:hypothetical protein